MMLGSHCIKTWSTTRATVALSSAEAELYDLTEGASQALGLMSLLGDLGQAVKTTLFTDASAAIGIVRRSGFGKLTLKRAIPLVARSGERGCGVPDEGEGHR